MSDPAESPQVDPGARLMKPRPRLFLVLLAGFVVWIALLVIFNRIG